MHEYRVGLARCPAHAASRRPVRRSAGAAEDADLAGMIGLAEIAGNACVDVGLLEPWLVSGFQFFFATSGHSPWSIGRNASSAGIVAISL